MQISSKTISKKREQELITRLATLLADFNHPKQVENFLKGFLSPTEQSVFAKRLAIIWQLSQGKSYEDIKNNLKVSSATISTVSDHHKKPGIVAALKKIELDHRLGIVLKNLPFFS